MKIGDHYFTAEAEYGGRPWDLGNLGVDEQDAETAIENARIWLSDLTAHERKYSRAWVTEWEVKSVNEETGESDYAQGVRTVWTSWELELV